MNGLLNSFNVLRGPDLNPMTKKAEDSLMNVLNILDDDESYSLALINSVGRFDWHMVDGTGRIWHFTKGGQISWNMVSEVVEQAVLDNAYALGWQDDRA